MGDGGISRKPGKSKASIGLDIGSHSIKIVELSGAPEKPSLVSFGLKKVLGSSQDAIVTSIKNLAEELKLSAKDVTIGVSGPSVIVRLISMPKMTDAELAGAVRFETEKFIPFDINDCVLDFQITAPATKEKNTADIILAAVKKDYCMQRVALAQAAGFTVSTVDVDILAVTNAFLGNLPPVDGTKTFAVIHVGAACTDISILKGGTPSFVRQISIGSNDCSAAISKGMGLSADAAEALKVSPQAKAQEVITCTKQVLNNLIDEVKLSFGYYENQSGRGIDEIYVAGGGATILGLEETFEEILGTKPRCWDPFQFLDKAQVAGGVTMEEKIKSAFGVAVGLALR